MCEVCSKLTIKTIEQHQMTSCSGDFIVNFEHILLLNSINEVENKELTYKEILVIVYCVPDLCNLCQIKMAALCLAMLFFK